MRDTDGSRRAFSGRFGCVLLGRNKNRWDELYDTEWQTRISEHCVGGLEKKTRCLALAGSFDEALFDHLVEMRLIPAGFHFAALTGEDYSYVEEIRDLPGTFRFHRLMELALINNQSAKAEDRPVARERILM